MTTPEEWRRIDAALDQILALPPEAWPAACERLAGGDVRLLRELESLLERVGGEDPVLDHPARRPAASLQPAAWGLAAGTSIGAYRVVELIGAGGMGEVYRAERADGQFEHQVAIKLMRREFSDRSRRFQAERQILARLQHPGIARLHDGGIADDGRPYMVMELVHGRPITVWCREHACTLVERLQLFIRVCEAVAHAHRNLVVHADLKPANVLVSPDGEVKLLDFGISRLLDEAPDQNTRHGGLTPGHAAPEQFTGGALTTATDVYALGMLLFELLTGAAAWAPDETSIAALVRRVVHEDVPAASAFAAARGNAPVPARRIAGDLDAIIAKAVRTEPERRYESVTLLQADVARALRSEPVSARSGARWYVLERFVRRHRAAVGVGVTVVGILLAAAVGIAWQGRVAQREAARAMAVKDFLISAFQASDPRIASDKPRGQATARELLDAGAGRIEGQFAGDPDLQIELLGTVAPIYRELGEGDRYRALQDREFKLARERFGDLHPAVTDILLNRAGDALQRSDYAGAFVLLDQAGALIDRSGRNRSAARARWWLTRGQALVSDGSRQEERMTAFGNAIELFAEVAPTDPRLVTALNELGNLHLSRMETAAAASSYRRALETAPSARDRNDGELLTIYGNLALALQYEGDLQGADEAYGNAARTAERTYGKRSWAYAVPAARHARMLHLGGQRARALSLYEDLRRDMPDDGTPNHDAGDVLESYGTALASEGRPRLAIPLLEAAAHHFRERPVYDYDLRRVGLELGDAYDTAGRTAEARETLRGALQERLMKDPPDMQAVLAIRERWGRFLLKEGDVDGAEQQFRAVLAAARGRPLAHVALARGDLASVAIARHESNAALADAAAAVELYDHVSGFRDVRMGPYLWRIYARALIAAGDKRHGALWAGKALDASLLYDAPESAAIAEARALLQAATTTSPAA